jgi:hypothetical protein
MPPISPNQLLARSYHRAVEVVKREDGRHLSQREYLDTTFGVNPATGKPYNERTLRKWVAGERKADKVVSRAKAGVGTLTQTVIIPGEHEQFRRVNIEVPIGRNRLDLFTPKGIQDRKRVAREVITEQNATPKGKWEYERITSTRGMKLGRAFQPRKPRRVEILSRKPRMKPPNGVTERRI